MPGPTYQSPTGEEVQIGGLHLNWKIIACMVTLLAVAIGLFAYRIKKRGDENRPVAAEQKPSLPPERRFATPTASPTETPGIIDRAKKLVSGNGQVIGKDQKIEMTPDQKFRLDYENAWYKAQLDARTTPGKTVTAPVPTPSPTPSPEQNADQALEFAKSAIAGGGMPALAGGGTSAGGPSMSGLPGMERDETHEERTEKRTRFATGEDTTRASDQALQPIENGVTLYQMDGIPCALDTALYSVLPGKVKCVVTTNVYGGPDRRWLIIPMQSEIVEEYDAGHVTYGDRRMLVVSLKLRLPKGRGTFILGRDSIAGEPDGSMGIEANVDNHVFDMARAALIGSIFGIGAQVAQGPYATQNPSTGQLVIQGLGQNLNQIGQRLAQREMMRPPTLYRERGYRFMVYLGRDIKLPPYAG